MEKARRDKETVVLYDRLNILVDRNERLFDEMIFLHRELADAQQKAADALAKKQTSLIDLEKDRNEIGAKLTVLKSFLLLYPDKINTSPEVNEILSDDYDYW